MLGIVGEEKKDDLTVNLCMWQITLQQPTRAYEI